MTNDPGVMALVDSLWVRLLVGQPVPTDGRVVPTRAVARLGCATCGAVHEVPAPIDGWTHDDDHFGRIEYWYRSRHATNCAGCGTEIEVELSYTVTEWQWPAERCELVLDGVRTSGGELGACPDTPPQ